MFGVEGPIVFEVGKFWYVSAEVKGGKWGRHHILISPNLKVLIKRKKSFIRLDSGCLSGVLGDITCDCLGQLRIAQGIALHNGGIIIHIPAHDGRGWQEYKMAHQRIMNETGLDTITVAKEFCDGEDKIDIRTFDEAATILKALGFPEGYKFNLGTKNPKKVRALLEAGFVVDAHGVSVDHKSRFLRRNLKAKHKFFVKQEQKYARNQKR